MPQTLNLESLEQEREAKDQVRSIRKENEELYKTRKDLQRKIAFYEVAERRRVTPIQPQKRNPKQREATALSLLSDLHIEERISKASTSGLNEYDPDIASRRVRNYFRNLLKLVENNRRDVTIHDLVLCLLGDNIHGFIHEEYLTTNYMTPIDASIFALEEIEAGLTFLLEHGKFRTIKVICKVGNHSRTTKKVYSESEAKQSYEWMLYKFLQRQLEAKHPGKVEFVIDESYFTYFTIYTKTIRAEHGHAFKYAGGIGGIFVPLVRHLYKTNKTKPFDLAVMGHWHQFESMSMALINGSICGFNAWNMKSGFDYQAPIQQFQLVDSKYGFTVNSKIFVE